MSDTTSADPKRTRNLILIAVGAVIIVATYLFLVIGQPVEMKDTSTGPAGLIAMAGYLVGAVLIASGSIHRLPTNTVAMIPVTGLVAAIISAPISAFIFGGATGGGTGAIVGAFQAMGQSLLAATTLQGLLSDPLDKLITFTVVVLILAALPSRFLQRFPFVRQHRVFGSAPVTPTPTPSAPAE